MGIKKAKKVLLAAFLAVLAVCCAALGVKIGKKAINFTDGFRRLRHQVNVIYDIGKDMKSLLVPLEDVPPAELCFIFVGHVYPFNGFDKNRETIDFFIEQTGDIDPARVIFGGDSVSSGSKEMLSYLRKAP